MEGSKWPTPAAAAGGGLALTSGAVRQHGGHGPSRYRGLAPDWSQLPSVELAEANDGQARLRVGRDTDLAAVVAAASDRADIVSFAYQPPTLSELFRQAVAA